MFSVEELKNLGIVANAPLSREEMKQAEEILKTVHQKTLNGIKEGKGPFYAEIYLDKKLVAAASNSVVEDNCSLCHAEINVLNKAHREFKSWSLSEKDLTIYINAEPCIMCMGAIMWSGVKRVFFSVSSKDVEEITGFDEGFKPDWTDEFKKRGIEVFGGIEAERGKEVLKEYIKSGNTIYKPR